MKTFKTYPIAFSLILVLGSCEKYLDVKQANTQTPVQTTEHCQLVLDNFNVMNSNVPSDGTLSSNDFYVNLQSDILLNGSQEDNQIYSWDPVGIRASSDPQWRKPYLAIYHANLVLEAVEKIEKKGGAEDITLNALRGSALFFRAFHHWQLAQLYAKPYSSNAANDPGIPVKQKSDINDQPPRGTLQGTYSAIRTDLLEAINLLPVTSPKNVASQPNKPAAYAMLARVYQTMEDYPNALVNANSALQLKSALLNFNDFSTTSSTPFPRLNSEVIFTAQSVTAPLLDPGSEGIPVAIIDRDLYNSYDDNDLRKVLFFKQNHSNVQIPLTDGSGNMQNVSAPDGTYSFSGNYLEQFSGTHFAGIAVDEMFLIRAECYARTGDVASAISDLNTLLRSRWKTGTYVDLPVTTAGDALAKILTERRKELLFRGLRWTDMRRLKEVADRKVSVVNPIVTGSISSGYTVRFIYQMTTPYLKLSASDLRYTLLIPNELMQFNLPQNRR